MRRKNVKSKVFWELLFSKALVKDLILQELTCYFCFFLLLRETEFCKGSDCSVVLLHVFEVLVT